jgi:hypothetical protein
VEAEHWESVSRTSWDPLVLRVRLSVGPLEDDGGLLDRRDATPFVAEAGGDFFGARAPVGMGPGSGRL